MDRATDGGPLTSTLGTLAAESTADAESASSAEAPVTGESIVIGGWVCSDANPFLHGMARSVRAPDGDWPIVLVLTAGDDPQENMPAIVVPPAVLRWLLTGERDD